VSGLGEVWFENRTAAQKASDTAEWKSVLEDAATVMDIEHVSAAWAEEHVIV
jgi:hypothetical protein